jgi:hypothetical protein
MDKKVMEKGVSASSRSTTDYRGMQAMQRHKMCLTVISSADIRIMGWDAPAKA